MKRNECWALVALVWAGCTAGPLAPDAPLPEPMEPAGHVFVGTYSVYSDGRLHNVTGDTLHLYDDGTYKTKTDGVPFWIVGRWTRHAGDYCALPNALRAEVLVLPCGAFLDPRVGGRLQDPSGVFLADGVSRYWDPGAVTTYRKAQL